MDGPCADRIVDTEVFEQVDPQDYDDSRDGTDTDRAERGHPVTRTRDGDEPSQKAVDADASVPLPETSVREEHRRESCRACRERGVRRDPADTFEVHRRQRRTRVEAVPSEPEDHSADRRDGHVVARGHAAPVALELPADT